MGLGGLVRQVSLPPSCIQTPAAGLGTRPVGTCSFPVPWGCPLHLPLQELSPERGSREGAIPSWGLDMWEAPSGASASAVSISGDPGGWAARVGRGGWARRVEGTAGWLPGGGRGAPGNAGWAWRALGSALPGGRRRAWERRVRRGSGGGKGGDPRGLAGGRGSRARGRWRLGPSRPSPGSSPRNRPPTAARGSRLPTPEPSRRLPLPAPGSLRLSRPSPSRRGGPAPGSNAGVC